MSSLIYVSPERGLRIREVLLAVNLSILSPTKACTMDKHEPFNMSLRYRVFGGFFLLLFRVKQAQCKYCNTTPIEDENNR
jgi:hypothetical protein